MPAGRRRTLIASALAVGLAMTAISSYAALAATPTAANAAGPTHNVIVLLRNQHANLQSGIGLSPARIAAAQSDQAPLLASAKKLGARNLHGYSVINGFAATVTAAQAASLAANPAVAGIWPDLPITKAAEPVLGAATTSSTSQNPPVSSICPSDPTKPLLTPEGLQTTHTAYADLSTPQAQNIVDGTGTKVGWIADGIDINDPDFIRANGTHVIVDYQDFSGEGLNTPSDSRESFGDASSIAAQGRQTYDLADWMNPAHPLPAGCTITVRGVAPGASLVGMKVFGDQPTAPTSRFIDAIDWAVSVDHVDVLNESFGANPFPDNGSDPITLADDAAVAAGVTVVSSTGDAGTAGTVGTPSDQPAVIGVAATTTYASYAQTTESGFQLSNGTWADDNISSVSSGGITQAARVPDLSAPGDSGWALCSLNTAVYQGCSGAGGNPSPIQEFGGTSESSPLVAGAAALVIEAYEHTHNGLRPAPALVKQFLTSTATDLGYPAYEQGAGELNSLAAVRAAESYQSPVRHGDAILAGSTTIGSTQLSAIGHPGAVVNNTVRLTNVGVHTSSFAVTTRTLDPTVLASRAGTLTMNTATAPTFIDSFGASRSYATRTFTVPHGATRLDAYAASVSPVSPIRITLLDPSGRFTAFSAPQNVADWAHVDAADPTPGTWTAIYFQSTGVAFDGPVRFKFTAHKDTTAGFVTPSHVTLHPGQSTTVTVHSKLGPEPGDTSASVQLAGAHVNESIPLTQRGLWPTNHQTQSFTGLLLGGNGRDEGIAQTNVYYLDVPADKENMSIGIKLLKDPDVEIQASLTAPNGQVAAYSSNFDVDNDNNPVHNDGLQLNALNPASGRWVLTLGLYNPVTGLEIQQHFNARLSFDTIKVKASLPDSTSARLAAGVPVEVPVKITNTGQVAQTYFADGRLDQTGTIALSDISGSGGQVTFPAGGFPFWLVPSDTSTLTATAHGDVPINMNWEFDSGEPQVYAPGVGDTATAVVTAPQVSAGLWAADIGEKGPFGGPPAPAGTVNVDVTAAGQLFDPAFDSTTGDVWTLGATSQTPDAMTAALLKRISVANRFATTAPKATAAGPAVTGDDATPTGPVTLEPGQSVTITVTITPQGTPGSVVKGHLYIDVFNFFELAGNQIVDLPYTYTIG